MTAQQVHWIRKSFVELSRHEHVAALIFYQRLFALDPALRPMFKNDIEEQSRKLLEMLGVLISLLDRPLSLELELKAMGARHAGYGVRDEHYAIVGRALLDMLSETLGQKLTPEALEAWAVLYEGVAAMMKAGAAEMNSKEGR